MCPSKKKVNFSVILVIQILFQVTFITAIEAVAATDVEEKVDAIAVEAELLCVAVVDVGGGGGGFLLLSDRTLYICYT